MPFSARSEVPMVAKRDNMLTHRDIQDRVWALNEDPNYTEDQKDDNACYWFGYQDAISGSWAYARITDMHQHANMHSHPDNYIRGFEDAMGDMELWDAIEEG